MTRGVGPTGVTGLDQPRPALGLRPWLAFFLARSLRFTVRFDMGDNATGSGDPAPRKGSMSEGWLISDGRVLASSLGPAQPREWLVGPGALPEGVGALVVAGPAVVVGHPVVRLGPASRVAALDRPRPLSLVGVGRHAVVVREELASQLAVGDEVQYRVVA